MPPDDRTDIPPSVREVLAYFLNHPGAAGSVRDLAESRIAQEIAFHNIKQVTAAVDWLLKHNLLVHKQDPILTLNDERVGDAQELVETLTSKARAESVEEAGERPERKAGRGDAEPVEPEPPPRSEPLLRSVPQRPRLVTPAPVPEFLKTAAVAWIDATLMRYHDDNPPSEGDHPGLSRAAATVKRLLTPVIEPESSAPPQRTRADDDHALLEALANAGDDEPLSLLVSRLGLTDTELKALLLCLAPEIDAKYQTVLGIFNDDLHGRRSVTVGLLCRLLGDPVDIRQELESSANLTRWRLLGEGPALPPADQPLHVDPFVVAWLFSPDSLLTSDPRLAPFIRHRAWPGAAWLRLDDEVAIIERLRELLTAPRREEWIAIAGGERNGSRAAVEAAADVAGLQLLRIVVPSPAPSDPTEVGEIIARLARAARLADAVPVVDARSLTSDTLGVAGLPRLLGALGQGPRPVLVITRDVERVVGSLPRTQGRCIHLELPHDVALASVYDEAAEQAGLDLTSDETERLALAYPLPLESIEDALWLATLNGAALRPRDEQFAALAAACRRVACPDLPRFGRRIEPAFSLEDVVLPEAPCAQLREIVTHVRHAPQVMHGWGFRQRLPYGRGVTALFSGPSGTGKTMAAQAIARELQTDAYIVDLSRVVSKYIGESEKNLDAVFEDAERAGAVLLFDEADALFGKRSEIKDAHDRYANIEVAYLLQRMEAFSGLAILTTNFRQNLDAAFVRRIRFIVEFPRPDQKAREAIWRRCLSTDALPAPKVNLPFLAKRLELTGGTIQQIAIRAAFAAAAAGAEEIEMTHVMAAGRAELIKLGLTATERELAEFERAFRRSAEVA